MRLKEKKNTLKSANSTGIGTGNALKTLTKVVDPSTVVVAYYCSLQQVQECFHLLNLISQHICTITRLIVMCTSFALLLLVNFHSRHTEKK